MTDSGRQPPFERFYDLNRLSEAGYETAITLGPEELSGLAEWADVISVNGFAGKVSLRRLSASRFAYAAELEAQITQNCAVTLEPVSSRISIDFTRTLHLVSHIRKVPDMSGELSPASGDEGVPEEIDNPRYDLAAPLLEEFLLAIDPYPRAEGVNFAAPEEEGDRPESPFVVLRALKAEP